MKPKLYVDFNEMIDDDLVLLSQNDTKLDFEGNEILLFEGLEIDIYMDDLDESGVKDDLIASGKAVRNNTEFFTYVKWLCKIDENGIQLQSELGK